MTYVTDLLNLILPFRWTCSCVVVRAKPLCHRRTWCRVIGTAQPPRSHQTGEPRACIHSSGACHPSQLHCTLALPNPPVGRVCFYDDGKLWECPRSFTCIRHKHNPFFSLVAVCEILLCPTPSTAIPRLQLAACLLWVTVKKKKIISPTLNTLHTSDTLRPSHQHVPPCACAGDVRCVQNTVSRNTESLVLLRFPVARPTNHAHHMRAIA